MLNIRSKLDALNFNRVAAMGRRRRKRERIIIYWRFMAKFTAISHQDVTPPPPPQPHYGSSYLQHRLKTQVTQKLHANCITEWNESTQRQKFMEFSQKEHF